jgi:hypothetical protein
MEQVLRFVAERQAALDKHPLFEWMAGAEVSAEGRLTMLPIMANFAMGFRDVNMWVLRYPQAANDLERGINIHTFEDQTHSRLYLEDWRRLGLDQRLGWQASDTLWWLFLSDANEAARRHGNYFLSMSAADGQDPLLRFAQSEVIEACGAVFFSHVAKVAVQYIEQSGIDLPYLGPHHLALETGHMDCEDLFEKQTLDDRSRARAVTLASTMFDIFTEAFDMYLRYAQRHVTTGVPPRPDSYRPITASRGGAAGTRPSTNGLVHDTQAPVQRLLEQRKERTAKHPLFTWFHNRSDDISALQALQRFIPMWAMDVMGYRDLNRYAMHYAEPHSDLEHAVNGWVDDLTTHNRLYLNDWKQLGLDELLGWNASGTLEFCYLDPQTDVHRRNIATFTRLAADHPEPVLRMWLMHALESSGDAFFRHSQVLAREAEDTARVRLDYFADRHDIAHQPQESTTSATVTFKDRAMSPGERDAAADIVETIFDAIDEQFDISLDVALSNKFDIP